MIYHDEARLDYMQSRPHVGRPGSPCLPPLNTCPISQFIPVWDPILPTTCLTTNDWAPCLEVATPTTSLLQNPGAATITYPYPQDRG